MNCMLLCVGGLIDRCGVLMCGFVFLFIFEGVFDYEDFGCFDFV